MPWKKKHEPFANFRDFQNVFEDKWHDVDIRQSESEKTWMTYSAHFLADQLIDDLAYCDVLV